MNDPIPPIMLDASAAQEVPTPILAEYVILTDQILNYDQLAKVRDFILNLAPTVKPGEPPRVMTAEESRKVVGIISTDRLTPMDFRPSTLRTRYPKETKR